MLTKLLRLPIPDQIKALLEKIDSEGAALDSSFRRKLDSLIHEDHLTRYERFLIKRALVKNQRAKTLDDAMCIVLNQEDERGRAEKQAMWNGAVPGALYSQHAQHISQHAQMMNNGYSDSRAIYGQNAAQNIFGHK